MVLIGFGEAEEKKLVGKMVYYKDTIWSTDREAQARATQLHNSGQYASVQKKKFTNAPMEYVVWRGESKRRGTRSAKKFEKRRRHKEMVEGKK